MSEARPRQVVYVVERSDRQTLTGPFTTSAAAWAWVDALPPSTEIVESVVLPVGEPT
jgi:hypothetical protein